MPRRIRLDLALLIALALAAGFAYLYCSAGDYFYPDSQTYLAPAQGMLHGFGFVDVHGRPESFRTPGYPLFLVPFLAATASALPILVAQNLMHAAIVAFVYLLAMRIGGSRLAAVSAGLVFALDIPSIHYANRVLSETLFTFVLVLLIALVLRVARSATVPAIAAAGLLGGALVMIRPVAILYAFLLAAFLAVRVRRAQAALFLLLALSLPIAWGLRNRQETGVFTISSVAGTNMLLHRAAPALVIDPEHDFKSDLAITQAELKADADEEIIRAERVADIRQVDQAVANEYYNRIGTRIALEHPVALAYVIARGLGVNLFDSYWESVMIVSTIPSPVLQATIPAIPPITAALAIIGIVAAWRRDPALALLIAATIAYFVFISAGSEAEARFRVPVIPLMAVAAGLGIETLRRGTRDTSFAG